MHSNCCAIRRTSRPFHFALRRRLKKRVETGSSRKRREEEEEEDKVYGRTVVKRDEVAYRRSSSKIVPITSGSIGGGPMANKYMPNVYTLPQD